MRGSGIGDGRSSARELHRSLVKQFQMHDDWERLAAAWSNHFSPMPTMQRIIARLAAAEATQRTVNVLTLSS